MSRIIDFHTHCFPDGLAPRAVAQLAATAAPYGYVPLTDGTAAGLMTSMDRAGISRSVVCNIATNPHQMAKVNDFALSLLASHPRLIPLGSVHPEAPAEAVDTELDRLAAAGIKGIKLHPDYVGVEIDSPAFAPILEGCARRGLFVITHAGFDPVAPDHIHCAPAMVLRVLEAHPTLRLIVAHTGGFNCEAEVLDKLCGRDVYLDTSLSAIRRADSAEQGRACAAILRAHRPDRLLFATDTPWSDPAAEIAFVRSAGLAEDAVEAILHRNAETLLGE